MNPQNLLLILSDEHNPKALGVAGHPDVRTPHLDMLATQGTRFTNATCASPICVPSRAALATGRYIFDSGYWDNVTAYDGRVPSWHHLLRASGHEVASIGKLHYRGHGGDDYGFAESLLPMHIHEGRGEIKMLLRNPPVRIGDGSQMLRGAKAGMSDYNRYDRDITQAAIHWLEQRAETRPEKPWVLMVSLVAPHFPLTVPGEFFDIYASRALAMPKAYRFGLNEAAHPYVRQYGEFSGYNRHFHTEKDVRTALAGYYGLISYLDHHVGMLMAALARTGLAQGTRVLYTSDHGDNAGARGLWGKSTMYKESVGVPLILAGAGISPGSIVDTAVSHIDLYPTILDAVGHDGNGVSAAPRARSILQPLPEDRKVLSEYHTVGSQSAVFMLQDAHTKYVHYRDMPDELFDLDKDPEELENLAPDHPTLLAHWRKELHAFCDPGQVDAMAKRKQAEWIEHYGGREAIAAGKGIGGYSPAPETTTRQ